MNHSVVVTGASTGIGYALCKLLCAYGYRVFGSVRRAEDAERLTVELGSNFRPLHFDVTNADAVHAAAEEVRAELGGWRLGALVNNAGIAVAGPLLDLPPDQLRHQLDVNLVGVTIVTQAFAPLLGTDSSLSGPPGRILNISSVGGRVAFPFMAPYHASKFGLEGLSESLRGELLPFGIDLVVVAPGGVRTPIWDKAEAVDVGPWQGTLYEEPLRRIRAEMIRNGRGGLTPEQIARSIHAILTARRPRLRYSLAKSWLEATVMERMPTRWFDRLVARQLGLRKPDPRSHIEAEDEEDRFNRR